MDRVLMRDMKRARTRDELLSLPPPPGRARARG